MTAMARQFLDKYWHDRISEKGLRQIAVNNLILLAAISYTIGISRAH
jgi:hypothetical protein